MRYPPDELLKPRIADYYETPKEFLDQLTFIDRALSKATSKSRTFVEQLWLDWEAFGMKTFLSRKQFTWLQELDAKKRK